MKRQNKVKVATKRFIGIAIVLLCCIGTAFAQEGAAKKVSLGAQWFNKSYLTGGTAEVGFSLFNNESFLLRNFITLGGGGALPGPALGTVGTGYGIISIGDKIQCGGIIKTSSVTFIPYGFLSGEFGLIKGSGTDFFHDPFTVDITMGGGFEIQFLQDQSFYIEYGGGLLLLPASSSVAIKGQTTLGLGYRFYL